MKYKYLIIFSLILLFFTNSFAQERKFEIDVSLTDKIIEKSDKQIIAKVKIKNKAEESLNTAGLGNVDLSFSKCEILDRCTGSEDRYVAQVQIPSKNIKKNETFELEVNLADLHWLSPMSSYLDVNWPKNFKKSMRTENIYFQANISLLDGYKKTGTKDEKIPIYRKYTSNTITVVFN